MKMIHTFYKLRMEATKESIEKHSLDVEVNRFNVLLSCLYDLIFFKTIISENSYVVYMRNSYFNIGFDCVTVLKSFTTKSKRGKGEYYKLRSKIKNKTILDVKESDGKEPIILGYIKSI